MLDAQQLGFDLCGCFKVWHSLLCLAMLLLMLESRSELHTQMQKQTLAHAELIP